MIGTLIMMAKAPVPGRVKTRLAANVGSEASAQLAEACILDLATRSWPVRRKVVAVDRDHACWTTVTQNGWELVEQGVGNLGDRMMRVLQTVADDGPMAMIGTDSPTIPTERVVVALDRARAGRIAFVPAFDGGYCLVATPEPIQALFEGVPWSAPDTLVSTVESLADSGWEVDVLQPWFDVDNVADLRWLRIHSRHSMERQVSAHAPRTLRLVERLLSK